MAKIRQKYSLDVILRNCLNNMQQICTISVSANFMHLIIKFCCRHKYHQSVFLFSKFNYWPNNFSNNIQQICIQNFRFIVIATVTYSKYVKLLQASAWTVDFTNFWRVFAICHNCVTARHAGRALRVRNAIKRPFAISIYAINKKNFFIVVLVTVHI